MNHRRDAAVGEGGRLRSGIVSRQHWELRNEMGRKRGKNGEETGKKLGVRIRLGGELTDQMSAGSSPLLESTLAHERAGIC
jgi:hypothetical protein